MQTKPDHPALVAILAAAGLALAAAGRTPLREAEQERARREAMRPRPEGNGRHAAKPSQIPLRGWWQVIKRTATQISDNRLMTEAAAVTFYTLLSIFPGLAALVSLYGLVADPATITGHLAALQGIIPGGGIEMIGTQLEALASRSSAGLGFGLALGLGVSLWTANQAMKALADALNQVNGETEKRGFVLRTAITLAFTLGMILFAILALVGVVAIPVMLSLVGLDGVVEFLLHWLRWPLLLVAVGLLLALVYRYLPSREEAKWRWITWGSGFAALAWLAMSLLFSWYVANFGNYDETYGALGAAVGFLTWVWLSALVVLIGAQLNIELEHQTARDTTTGPEKPMGTRGARPADRVAAEA